MDLLKVEEIIVGTTMSNTDSGTKSDESSATSLLQISGDYDDLHCPECLITFPSAKFKQNHMRRTHPEQYTRHLMQNDTLFSCYKCDKLFASPEELRVHSGRHHQVDDVPICSSCTQVFANFTALYKHQRKGCAKDTWRCRDCDVSYRNLIDFHVHCIEKHDRDVAAAAAQSGERTCSVCWHHFLTNEALRNHQERVDSAEIKPAVKRALQAKTKRTRRKRKKIEEEEEEDDDEDEEDEEEEEEAQQLNIPCPEEDCDLVFPSIDALRAHKRSQHLAQPPSSSTRKKC